MWENFLAKFSKWRQDNNLEVTWFLVGFLAAAGVGSFEKGKLIEAFVLWIIAFINYKLRKY